MKISSSFPALAAVVSICALPFSAAAQINSGQTESGQSESRRFTFGTSVTASTLGVGIQGAVSVAKYSNVRAGFNIFNFSDTFTKDQITYKGDLKLRSAELLYDQYIPHAGGLHISPGLLISNGNTLSANASIPAGQTFTLGGTSYFSGQTNPVTGAGSINFRKAAPMILIGFGNPVPRSGHHITFTAEVGVVFQGAPSTKLNLSGSACALSASDGCLNAGSDPTVQSNVQAEQAKLNSDLKILKFYPVVSMGVGYRF